MKLESRGPNKSKRQVEGASRPALDWVWHAAAKQRAGTTRSPASENQSRQHLAPLTLNVSLQMEATDHKPFPSVAAWSHPEPISLRLARAS